MPGESGLNRRLEAAEELRLEPASRIAPPVSRWRRALAFLLRALLPVVILALALPYAWEIYRTQPVAERRPPARIAPLVEVVTARAATRGPVIEGWGEVVPERTLTLRPEITGRVVEVNPRLLAGELVRAGEVLVRLDDRELRLAVAAAEAEVRRIEARIEIERGQQLRARRDLERLGDDLTEAQRRLILRAPQMDELRAELAAARARLEEARVALSKAVIAAPFDAVVRSAEIAVGTVLTQGSEAATLVPAARFRVTVAVPVSALGLIEPIEGRPVRLDAPGVWPAGASRSGVIEGLGAELTPSGRMAEILVAVDDPLALRPENAGAPPLLLGSFLRMRVEGPPLEGAVVIDRALLRDGDTVWVLTPENRLEVRPVEVAWRGPDEVLVTDGLEPGERLVTTPLATFTPGMALRAARSGPGAAGAGSGG